MIDSPFGGPCASWSGRRSCRLQTFATLLAILPLSAPLVPQRADEAARHISVGWTVPATNGAQIAVLAIVGRRSVNRLHADPHTAQTGRSRRPLWVLQQALCAPACRQAIWAFDLKKLALASACRWRKWPTTSSAAPVALPGMTNSSGRYDARGHCLEPGIPNEGPGSSFRRNKHKFLDEVLRAERSHDRGIEQIPLRAS